MLIDVAMQVAPDIEVVFLDTQYHFAETLWYVEQVRARYDLNLTRRCARRPTPDDLWHSDPDACCRDAQGRAARSARSKGKARVDDRPAPRRGADPGARADRRATTSAAGS